MIYTCKNGAMICLIEGSNSWHLHDIENDAMPGIHPSISMMPHDRFFLVTVLLLVGNLKMRYEHIKNIYMSNTNKHKGIIKGES